jgi:hypothetical protein
LMKSSGTYGETHRSSSGVPVLGSGFFTRRTLPQNLGCVQGAVEYQILQS